MQIEICQIKKVIQLHETMIVRWGVMLVGPTGGGKTVVLHVSTCTLLHVPFSSLLIVTYLTDHKYILLNNLYI